MGVFEILLLVLGTRHVVQYQARPLVVAGVYSMVFLASDLLFGDRLTGALALRAVGFACVAVYLALVSRFGESGFYWALLVLGAMLPWGVRMLGSSLGL